MVVFGGSVSSSGVVWLVVCLFVIGYVIEFNVVVGSFWNDVMVLVMMVVDLFFVYVIVSV